ncbi:hypothetical protein B7494_g2522 [Chlorociboria aeruginascens]|nr:hypothetical protein B7494_g2522 [Chlorociboria aeruginascens]
MPIPGLEEASNNNKENPGAAESVGPSTQRNQLVTTTSKDTYPKQASKQEGSLSKNNISKVKICGVLPAPSHASRPKLMPCSCSVVCSAAHKARHPLEPPSIPTPKPASPTPKPGFQSRPTPGTLAAAGARGPFAALDDSEELRALFTVYPRLASQLDELNKATLCPDINLATPAGVSSKFSGRSNTSWNSDLGLQNGVKALSRARMANGKDGEGIREFSKLILQILSGDEGIDAKRQIERELAEEDAMIISLLLDREI